MQKHEFEERIESTVSDEDYKLIEFVYQFHPVIRNVSGKDEVAELYKSFGMALFRDMEPRAKKAKEVEEKMTSCRLEIETLTELLATRKAEMKDLEAELQELRILNMKNNGQVINMNLVSVGTINASLVIPREVFKSSILANASAIIGLHNHPSGNVKPSKEDMIVTRKLQKCGQLLGIELLDHIIVGGTNGKMLSFREEKMLNVTGRMGEMER